MLFERTALSRRPRQLAQVELKALRERDQLTPDLVFRDPYFLDFLGLKDTYAERDLETAILREIRPDWLPTLRSVTEFAPLVRCELRGRASARSATGAFCLEQAQSRRSLVCCRSGFRGGTGRGH
jgi:hypothetical protein